jgi:hypothetical protein
MREARRDSAPLVLEVSHGGKSHCRYDGIGIIVYNRSIDGEHREQASHS